MELCSEEENSNVGVLSFVRPEAVFVYATDRISQAGIAAEIRPRPELRIVAEGDVDAATVAIVVADEVNEDTVRVLKGLQRNGSPRIVLVVTHLDDAGLLSAVEFGVCGLVRRSEATVGTLVAAVRATAAGDGTIPPDLLGRLLAQIGQLQRQVLAPRGLSFNGFREREIEVRSEATERLTRAQQVSDLLGEDGNMAGRGSVRPTCFFITLRRVGIPLEFGATVVIAGSVIALIGGLLGHFSSP